MARDDQMTGSGTGRDADQPRDTWEDIGQTNNHGVSGEKGGKAGNTGNDSTEDDGDSWNDSTMNEV